MSELISGREAAKILRVVPQTISNWVASGKLVPVQKLENGYMFLFDRAEIEQLAAQRNAEPQQSNEAAVSSAA